MRRCIKSPCLQEESGTNETTLKIQTGLKINYFWIILKRLRDPNKIAQKSQFKVPDSKINMRPEKMDL
jgi:hypothetical protein